MFTWVNYVDWLREKEKIEGNKKEWEFRYNSTKTFKSIFSKYSGKLLCLLVILLETFLIYQSKKDFIIKSM